MEIIIRKCDNFNSFWSLFETSWPKLDFNEIIRQQAIGNISARLLFLKASGFIRSEASWNLTCRFHQEIVQIMHVNTNMEYERPGKSYLHLAGINVGVTNANRTSTIIMEGRHFHENTTFKNLGALLQKTMTATLLWIMKVTYLSVDFSDQNCVATVQCYTNIIDLHFPYLPPYLISRHT